MDLIIWKNFSKKINSTKQPSADDGTTVSVVLKQDTSLESPTFLIDGIDLDVNYCKWENHYYYINDIILENNNIYELRCTQDVLATYKSDIQGYTGYVEYCDSFSNKWIPDKRYTMTNTVSASSNEAPVLFTDTTGTLIMTVAGVNDPAQVGFTTMYAISQANMKNYADWMYDDTVWAQLKQKFTDPYKALIEAHWVPWDITATGTTIFIGDDDSQIVAKGLKSSMVSTGSTITIDIPWVYNDWRDFSPYAVMEIYLPFYGAVTLDQSKFAGETQLTIQYILDPISGEVLYNLRCGNWTASYRVDASVPLAIGQTTGQKVTGIGEIAGGIGTLIGGAIASVVTGGLSAGAAASVIAGGVSSVGIGALTYFSEETSGRGGNGGFASGNLVIKSATDSFLRKIKLTLFAHTFTTAAASEMVGVCGKPWFKTMSLSTLSGYVQCGGASVPIAGLSNDKEQVNTWLNQGLFIE